MPTFQTRLAQLELKLPARRDDDFDIERALDFRIAGMPRCVSQARYILALDELARQPGCPMPVQQECERRIRAVIPAFRYELSGSGVDDPRLQVDENRSRVDAALEVIRRLEQSHDTRQ